MSFFRKNKKLKLELQVHTGLLSSFQSKSLIANDERKQSVIINFNETLKAADLLNEVRAVGIGMSKFPFLQRLKYRLSSLRNLLNAFFITVVIGLLGAFGNAFFEILVKAVKSGLAALHLHNNPIFYLIFLLFFLLIAISPGVLNDNFNSIIEWINKRFSKEQRMHQLAAKGIIRIVNKTKGHQTVKLVTPAQYPKHQNFLFKHFLPLARTKKLLVEIHLLNEELDDFKEMINRSPFINCSLNTKQATKPVNATLLTEEEHKMMQLLLFFSIINPQNKQQNSFDLSLEMCLLYIDRYRYRLTAYSNIDKLKLQQFINRCINDYGLIETVIAGEHKRHKLRMPNSFVLNTNDYNAISNIVSIDYTLYKDEIVQPLSHLIILKHHRNQSYINSSKAEVMSSLINRIDKSEDYKLLIDYEELLYPNNEDKMETNVLRAIDSLSLLQLGNINFMAGAYQRAIDAFSTASLMYPLKAKIGIAKTFERKGDSARAIETIKNLEQLFEERTFNYYEDKIYLLEFYLEKSWIIVSGRLKEYYHEGKAALDEAHHLIIELDNIKYDVKHLFTYYNCVANYNEWDAHYQGAIKAYETILSLPGCKARSISTVYVNIGIAYRFLAKVQDFDTNIEQSVYYLSKGHDLKEKLADVAQLPIAAHNLAESCILQAVRSKTHQEKMDLLKQANRVALSGLELQKQTGSSRKQGQLLAETIISYQLSGHTSTSVLKPYEDELNRWLLSHREGYDYEVVNELLKLAPVNPKVP